MMPFKVTIFFKDGTKDKLKDVFTTLETTQFHLILIDIDGKQVCYAIEDIRDYYIENTWP